MPTFWRGFWPYAGSGEKENPYSRCLSWDKQPFCSIEQIADKIKMHKINVHDAKRPSFIKKSYVNPLITGKFIVWAYIVLLPATFESCDPGPNPTHTIKIFFSMC